MPVVGDEQRNALVVETRPRRLAIVTSRASSSAPRCVRCATIPSVSRARSGAEERVRTSALRRLRIAITGGRHFTRSRYNVCAAREADGAKHVVEAAARLPDERIAERIFVGPRTFADEHPVRVLVADAKTVLLRLACSGHTVHSARFALSASQSICISKHVACHRVTAETAHPGRHQAPACGRWPSP